VEWSERDLSLRGVGLPLSFERIFRGSVTSYAGPLGSSWEFSWNKRLFEETSGDVSFYDMGRIDLYTEDSGDYTSPAGRYDLLEKDTGPSPDIFTRTDKFGTVETYEDEGDDWFRLKTIVDTNGNTLTFGYDAYSRLTTVTDTLSQVTTIAYDGNDRIATITDHDSRVWTYGYTSGRLTSVSNPLSQVTTYGYDGSGRLAAVHLPEDGVSVNSYAFTYETNGDTATATANGGTWSFDYDTTNHVTTVTDPEANVTEYHYDNDDLITLRVVTVGAVEYRLGLTYDADAEVTLVEFPRDNRLAYTYDSVGNITSVQFQEDEEDTTDPVEWEYTYTSLSRLATLTDPNDRTWTYTYDGDGNLTELEAPAVTLPSGIATTDKNGNSVYDGTISTTYTYGATGLVETITDAFGTVTTYDYVQVNSKDAYVSSITADTGGLDLVTAYEYDAVGNMTSVTDPETHETTHTYDDMDRRTSTTEPLSVVIENTYDDNGRLVQTRRTNDTDVGDAWFNQYYDYDADNHLWKTRADDGSGSTIDTVFEYDGNGQRTKTTTPAGRVTNHAYDVRGLHASTTREAASGNATSEVVYDGNGNVIERKDPLDHSTTYEYDLLDRLVKVTGAEGAYRTMEYDAAGNLTKTSWFNVANTKLAETTQAYDQANRLYLTERMAKKADLSTNLGDGVQSKTVWRDERGAVIESSGDICGCASTTYEYDALGRKVATYDALPGSQQNSTEYEYDGSGNVVTVTRHDATQDSGLEASKDIVTHFTYDARDRRTETELVIDVSTSSVTTYAYGDRDQLTQVTDPVGRVTKHEYNEQLWTTRDIQETAGDDVITEYEYDDDGKMLVYRAKNSITGDQETEYAYDGMGRLLTTTWPDAETTTHTYDVASHRATSTDPNGTVTTFTYDDDGRLVLQEMALGTNVIGIDEIQYTYDGMGRRLSADALEDTTFSSSIDWTYNTLGEIETEKQVIDGYNSGNGRTITYAYNVKGQKTSTTYPVSGDVVTFDRDELDRVDSISRNSTEVVDYTFSGQRVLRKAYPGSHANYSYDGAGRLLTIHHKDAGSGNTLAKFDYGYDLSNQALWMDKQFYDDGSNTRILDDTTDKGDQYGYDGAGRLVEVLRGVATADITNSLATNLAGNDYDDHVEYSYDQTGNRLERTIDGTSDVAYEYNVVNEMVEEGGNSLSYDDNGNFTGTSHSHKYDFRNQLASYTEGTVVTTWHRDALGRIIQRDMSDRPAKPRNYYDGQHRVEAASWSGTAESLRKTFVYGESPDELLEYVDVAANPDKLYFAHADRLGSVMVLAEPDGDIAESYRYREFGEPSVVDDAFDKVSPIESPVGNPVWYTGRLYAAEVSAEGDPWYDYRARHYRADAGRFVQRDSMRHEEWYVYVSNSAVSRTDPSGNQSLSTIPVPPTPPGIVVSQTGGTGSSVGSGSGLGGTDGWENMEVYVSGCGAANDAIDSFVTSISNPGGCLVVHCGCTGMNQGWGGQAFAPREYPGLDFETKVNGEQCGVVCINSMIDMSADPCEQNITLGMPRDGQPQGLWWLIAHEVGHGECGWTNNQNYIGASPPGIVGPPLPFNTIEDCATNYANAVLEGSGSPCPGYESGQYPTPSVGKSK